MNAAPTNATLPARPEKPHDSNPVATGCLQGRCVPSKNSVDDSTNADLPAVQLAAGMVCVLTTSKKYTHQNRPLTLITHSTRATGAHNNTEFLHLV